MIDHTFGNCLEQSESHQSGWVFKQKRLVQRFENGCRFVKGNRQENIRFDDVQAFSFLCTSFFMNGIAQGTHYSLRIWTSESDLEPACDFDFPLWSRWNGDRFLGIPLWLNRENPENDLTMESIRHELTNIVLKQLIQKFDSDQSTPWVPGVNITNTGIEFQHKRGSNLTPWEMTTIKEIKNAGECHVISDASDFPTLTIQAGDINYYPGLKLVQRLIQKPSR